jgi:hypothetical protein
MKTGVYKAALPDRPPPERGTALGQCRSDGIVTANALRDYRCYPLGSDNRIKDVIEFAAASDAEAIEAAEQCLGRLRIYAGVELWEGARRVFVRLPPPGANVERRKL